MRTPMSDFLHRITSRSNTYSDNTVKKIFLNHSFGDTSRSHEKLNLMFV